MKNREILNKICIYDLLCRINNNDSNCIIHVLEGKGTDIYRGDRYNQDCKRCLADWLNEESTIPIYERSDTE